MFLFLVQLVQCSLLHEYSITFLYWERLKIFLMLILAIAAKFDVEHTNDVDSVLDFMGKMQPTLQSNRQVP